MPLHLSWTSWLRSQTRRPEFLWRMVLGILLIGAAAGVVADLVCEAWIHLDEENSDVQNEDDDDAQPDDQKPSPTELLDAYAEQGDWWAVWWRVPQTMIASWSNAGATLLAALTGVCWFLFNLSAAQVASWRDPRLYCLGIGLALGVVSIWPTRFFILWQEYAWGLQESQQLVAGMRFWILGVGLREEFAKLICLLPLLPWLVRRGDQLTALTASACVGVGFAMQENVNYIYGTIGTATLTRLLMPAPLHMAMTGLIGLAAYRACQWPREWGRHFFLVFGLIVFAHGLYDALFSLQLPVFESRFQGEQGFASYLIFLALIYQFFHELRELRTQRSAIISLPAVFLFSVSLVAAATFVYLCAALGFRTAGDVLMGSILAQGIMVYLFLREMPESMVTV